MFDLLKNSLKTGCGLAALATALFFSIHMEWLKSGLFSQLSQEQTFSFLIYSLIMTGVAFLFLVLIHYRMKGRERLTEHSDRSSIAYAEKDSVAVSNTGKGNVSVNVGKK